MGWWSATILGGDDPLDMVADVAKMAGIEYAWEADWDDSPEVAKKALESLDVRRYLDYIHGSHAPGIAAQVAVLMHCTVGARLPAELKTLGISACETEDCSSWNNPGERKARLQEFAAIVRNYDGTPSQPPAEGLLQKLSEHLARGKSGLLNDNS